MQSTKFVFTEVTYSYSQSGEISPQAHPLRRSGVQSMTVFCKSCEACWGESKGSGLVASINHVKVSCPKCPESEWVPTTLLLNGEA